MLSSAYLKIKIDKYPKVNSIPFIGYSIARHLLIGYLCLAISGIIIGACWAANLVLRSPVAEATLSRPLPPSPPTRISGQ